MGIFGLKVHFSGVMANGSLSTPKPSFSDFVDFDFCRGNGFATRLSFVTVQCQRRIQILCPNKNPEFCTLLALN